MARNLDQCTIAELKFCDLILEGLAIEVAYQQVSQYAGRAGGYGHVMARRPRVQQKLLELRLGLEKKFNLTRERAVDELEAIAFATLDDYVEWDEDGSARIKPSGELTKRQAKALKSIKIDKDGRATLEFYSKLDAMAQISKLMGWLEGDVNITQNNFVVQAPAVVDDAQEFERLAQTFLDITPETPAKE